MNVPSQAPQERRGATAPPATVHSLVFFGGIILAVGVVAAGALAIWGPENDVEKRRQAPPGYASAAADSAMAMVSAEPPAPAVLPETAPAPEPSAEAPPPEPKKGTGGGKKRGGRPGGRKH